MLRDPRAAVPSQGGARQLLEHFHSFREADFVFSHPFHTEREMGGAPSFLTPSGKMP